MLWPSQNRILIYDMKPTSSQKEVINQLIFIESFDTLLSELEHRRGELRDDLMQLINAGLVEVFDADRARRLSGYDADRLERFCFRATSKGLAARL